MHISKYFHFSYQQAIETHICSLNLKDMDLEFHLNHRNIMQPAYWNPQAGFKPMTAIQGDKHITSQPQLGH